ncbi:MAG: YlmC/YmxH family sporulation protein [Oscillospiraceae bacterium]|jgi:YlmC/YmxH family sporulation protein|nr:YlmC/YmxH family sporulation protein [Oscillospiraceae bacterium]
METRIADLRCKEVINICDGQRLGYVEDVLFGIPDGRVVALIVPGPARFFGLFGREDDYMIPWDRIMRIGEDIIIVEISEQNRRKRERRKFF